MKEREEKRREEYAYVRTRREEKTRTRQAPRSLEWSNCTRINYLQKKASVHAYVNVGIISHIRVNFVLVIYYVIGRS